MASIFEQPPPGVVGSSVLTPEQKQRVFALDAANRTIGDWNDSTVDDVVKVAAFITDGVGGYAVATATLDEQLRAYSNVVPTLMLPTYDEANTYPDVAPGMGRDGGYPHTDVSGVAWDGTRARSLDLDAQDDLTRRTPE